MFDKSQADMAKTLWEQSRAAALQAYEGWSMVLKSQKALMDSMRNAGPPFAMAADQFDKLVQFQGEQYKAAVAYMDKMSAEYQKLLAQQQKK